MTIIAVKVEKKKITLASDSMVTSNNVYYINKLCTVWNISFWWAGLLSELQIMERFLKENGYDEKTIKSEDALFKIFGSFYKYLKDNGYIDDRENFEKCVYNDFIFVIKNLWKAYKYTCCCLMEIKEFDAIWSGASNAIPILDYTGEIKKAIEYAIKYNRGCWGDINILEIIIK